VELVVSVDLREARHRAEKFITATTYMADQGAPEIVYDGRFCARFVIELIDELEAERSVRQAIQAARDEALDVLARQAGRAAA
jgi:hypothetical protein